MTDQSDNKQGKEIMAVLGKNFMSDRDKMKQIGIDVDLSSEEMNDLADEFIFDEIDNDQPIPNNLKVVKIEQHLREFLWKRKKATH